MRRLLLAPAIATLVLALPAAARDGFLEDGGGIRTERVVGTPYGPAVIEVPAIGQDRPFLRDGGGIRFAPELPRYGSASGAPTRSGGWRSSSPSVVEAAPDGMQSAVSGGISVVVLNAPSAVGTTRRDEQAYGGPKILQVATARLDRRSFDASGLDVVRSGATKIIRIAPARAATRADAETDNAALDDGLQLDDGSALAALPAVRPETDGTDAVQDDPSRIGTAPQNGTALGSSQDAARADVVPETSDDDPEPWTEAWREDCVQRYPDFDASLGTYRDAAGRRHFCTGIR